MAPTDSNEDKETPGHGQNAPGGSARIRWQLLWRGNTIELPRQGALVVGRSPRCDIVLDDTQVSRTHCRLTVSAAGLTVQDLGSSNGLYVNGERLIGSLVLAGGDRLLLGAEELIVSSGGQVAGAVDSRAHLTPESSVAHDPDSPAAWRRMTPGADPQIITTRKADAFATLGKLADRMLESGRHEAAAKILAGHMKSVLAAVREGRAPPDEVIEGSTRYALKLAASEASWIDYVVDLHLALRRALPANAVEQIRSLLQSGVEVDRELLARYKVVVRTAALEGAISDRAAAAAILALGSGPEPR